MKVFCFDAFELSVSRRLLLDSGNPVRLGSRALEILIALVSRAGEVVSKQDLIQCAWPGVPDSEQNLRVHVGMLRKCLGDRPDGGPYIVSVAGQGYSFAAPVSRASSLVGRQQVVEFLVGALQLQRLVTLVGAGGVGKSAVGGAVTGNLGDVTYLDVESEGERLESVLRDARGVIFLDNCDSLVDRVAHLVEEVLTSSSAPSVLVTCREPLRCQAEWLYRLPPLAVPDECSGLTAAEALAYPAVELFVARAIRADESFQITDENASVIASICRFTDGVPLALELLAASGDCYVVLEQLETDPLSLTGALGLRLESSYAALPSREQALFRRLSSFPGFFSSESARAVACGKLVRDRDVLEGLMSLAERSLLVAETGEPFARYRLSHLVRAFARGKLLADEREQAVTLTPA